MNFEKLYKENINRKTQEVKQIPSNFIINAKLNNLTKRNKKIILIGSIILSIILIITFLSSLKAMISSFFLLIILILLSVFFNTYSIIGKEGIIKIKTNSQEIKINKEKIKNIYLEEYTYRIFIKKRKGYVLVILYETPNNNICDITLNTILLSPKDLQNWFFNITLKEMISNNQERCIKYKRKRLLKKIIFYSIMLIITFIVLIIY